MAAVPFHVKAVYEYTSEHDDDLSFPIGQIIVVTEIEDEDWYVGQYTDGSGGKHDGLFPKNYVERYEPPAPPRPSRPRPKKEAAPAVEPDPPAPAKVVSPVEPASASVEEPPVAASQPELQRPTPVEPEPARAEQPPPAPKPQPAKPAAPPSAKEPAPEPAAKPSSFRDRIAAFNKPAAPPIAPKPASVGGPQTFIKKPYVAPPPSRNAYVPPPTKEAVQPQKTYRREEDPEIAEAQAQAQRDAEQAGLTAAADPEEAEGEAPKSTSLKDRIAMLQKQQQEQAARQAEAASKKEQKRPGQPRTDSQEMEPHEEEPELSKVASPDSVVDVGVAKQPSVRRPQVPQVTPEVPPPREVPSDGNDADQSGAGETTEDPEDASDTEIDDVEERQARPGRPVPPPAVPSRTSTSGTRDPVAKEIEAEEQQEEDEEIDEETRRKEELRARMAKMSGGMGMAGFFNPAAAAAAGPPQRKGSDQRAPSSEARSPPPPPQRAPMVPVPGMGLPPKTQSPVAEPSASVRPATVGAFPEDDDDEDEPEAPTARAPPVPQERPMPPPPQARMAPPVPTGERSVPILPETRTAPPPPPHAAAAHDIESDGDEPTPLAEDVVPMPPSIATDLPIRAAPTSPPSASRQPPTAAPLSATDKRMSRPPPPIPGAVPAAVEARAPPPPPPGAPPSRSATVKEASKPPPDGESDYEGDYDTDIGSAVPHKDALNKAHEREPGIDETTLSEDTAAAITPSPIPPPSQRAAPPPPPHQAPVRQSTDQPRAPPPAPPARAATGDDDDYDPYRHDSGFPPPSAARKTRTGDVIQESDPSLYEVSPQEASRRVPPPAAPPTQPPPPQRHPVPPPPPPEHTEPVIAPPSRQSTDMSRRSVDVRRSIDPSVRPGEGSSIARDVDLGESSLWWSQPDMPPPVFQNRPDVAFEIEESSTSKRGGRTTISKDVYVLFQDYSQTVVTARFDAKEPGSNVHLEQRHEPPPARLRQDELQSAHEQFGVAVADAASQRQGNTVGDGSPTALVSDLLATAAPNALKAVGSRAYGVLVYANMANASVQQHDEIRPGDIVSFRNARFQGKHGAMHAKYSLDVGKPEHVAVVMEWDGTKKKIRAWEQGREKDRKVKVESFKVGDLRSGEVKVWRVVGRGYVGWESN